MLVRPQWAMANIQRIFKLKFVGLRGGFLTSELQSLLSHLL